MKAKKIKKTMKAKTSKTSTKAKTTKKAKSTKGAKKVKASSESLKGQKIKSLRLPMTGGKKFDLKEFSGQKVVLYFYPKDMTPGCTIEGHEFSQLKTEFNKYNTLVFGISRDSVERHEKFINKENYNIELISDEDEMACKIFDVIKEKNMYGKKVMGIERSTFLIDEDGKVEKEWRKVKAEGHAQEVLNYIKG